MFRFLLSNWLPVDSLDFQHISSRTYFWTHTLFCSVVSLIIYIEAINFASLTLAFPEWTAAAIIATTTTSSGTMIKINERRPKKVVKIIFENKFSLLFSLSHSSLVKCQIRTVLKWFIRLTCAAHSRWWQNISLTTKSSFKHNNCYYSSSDWGSFSLCQRWLFFLIIFQYYYYFELISLHFPSTLLFFFFTSLSLYSFILSFSCSLIVLMLRSSNEIYFNK